jgi:hypothetical protein
MVRFCEDCLLECEKCKNDVCYLCEALRGKICKPCAGIQPQKYVDFDCCVCGKNVESAEYMKSESGNVFCMDCTKGMKRCNRFVAAE